MSRRKYEKIMKIIVSYIFWIFGVRKPVGYR